MRKYMPKQGEKYSIAAVHLDGGMLRARDIPLGRRL